MPAPSLPTPLGVPIDTGLAGLVTLLRFHGIGATANQLQHRFGTSGEPFDLPTLVRAAKTLGLKARRVRTPADRLATTPMPALALLKDGRFAILGKQAEGKILVQDPATGRPVMVALAEFAETWTGELLLLARRSSLSDLGRPFGLGWFMHAVHKYRAILSEVLIASFFIQLLGLVSPLFFQVVVDKVLVHRGSSTLDVLIIGLLTVSLFEMILVH